MKDSDSKLYMRNEETGEDREEKPVVELVPH